MLGVAICSQAVLIRYHHEFVPSILQLKQCRDHERFKLQFIQPINLKINRGLDNQGAVTVDEKYAAFAHDTSPCQSIITDMSVSTSDALPTLMRRQSCSRGSELKPRNVIPALAQ